MPVLHKPYVNEVILWGQDLSLNSLLMYKGKGFRSFLKGNVGSIGQSTSKLLAVKVRGLQKKSATSAVTAKMCASAFSPGSTLPVVESFLKFHGW